MPTYIAFLRAVNVGGRFVKMVDLRNGLSDKGFGHVESYIQSGNIRFTSSLRAATKVEAAVEAALEELCGFTVKTVVRTPTQLGELTSYGTGLVSPLNGDVRRYVAFLQHDPDAEFLATMNGWGVAGERAQVKGRELYLWLAHPSHESKLTNARIERRGVVATTRDWKVVSALGVLWGTSP